MVLRPRRVMAAEAAVGGFFGQIVEFHQRWLKRALEKPRMLVILSLGGWVLHGYLQGLEYQGPKLVPRLGLAIEHRARTTER